VDVGVAAEVVQEVLERAVLLLRHELLHHFAKGLEDRVVVDAREVKGGMKLVETEFRQVLRDRLLHLVLTVDLLLVRQEQVSVHL